MNANFNILILCTGNSARSLITETLIRDLGKSVGFVAYSAGSKPKGKPHPMSLVVLGEKGHDTSALRSKSWDEFGGDDAPTMDLVITVCGNARDEVCPIWPGHPLQVHWGVDDPAAIEGEGQRQAFEDAYAALRERVEKLVQLDVRAMQASDLRAALDDIHTSSSGVVE